MTTTPIEWVRGDDAMPGKSWNPIVGCSIKSTGCINCYAMPIAARLARIGTTRAKYEGTIRHVNGNPVWTGRLNLDEKALLAPFGWKKPRRVFVNSMGDLFHEDVATAWLDRVFRVMRNCPRHTFMVLTKRPEQMHDYLRGQPILANVWLGVSTENQSTAEERIPILLDTPAAVHWISAEPLLEPLELFPDLMLRFDCGRIVKLDWVVMGGESGDDARPCNLEWFRIITRQCRAAGVPVFLKQLGSNTYDKTPYPWEAVRLHRKGGDMTEWPPELRVLREFANREGIPPS